MTTNMRSQCDIKVCRHGQEVQLLLKQNITKGNKCEPKDCECGMTVGARLGGLSISQTALMPNYAWSFQIMLWKKPLSFSYLGKKEIMKKFIAMSGLSCLGWSSTFSTDMHGRWNESMQIYRIIASELIIFCHWSALLHWMWSCSQELIAGLFRGVCNES